jgi:hypothetical protein
MKNIKNNLSDIILLKDRDWSVIDSELCRVIDFTPWVLVKDGKIGKLNITSPYASVHLECKKMLGKKITGFITHKVDFIHLWLAFKERTVKQDEEVLITWSRKHYKLNLKLLKFLTVPFWPKLWVMICPKGAFELEDRNYRPELAGEARWNAVKPIAQWKPEIME